MINKLYENLEGCGSDAVTVVDSESSQHSGYVVKNVFTLADEEINLGPQGSPESTYWLPGSQNVQNWKFVLDLGCKQEFNEVKVVNGHNGQSMKRSTKQLR